MYIAEDKIADIAIENEKEVRERPGNIPEPVTEAENNETLERIAVKNGQKIDVVLVSEIIHLQAEGDYVMIHSTKGKFLKEQTMKSFESGLPQDKFVRVHRSSIVNIEFISQIELYDKQSQLLKLKNGGHVRISLSGYKALKKTLGL
jgi:DNA-binding LytR/AlgR family response regulator